MSQALPRVARAEPPIGSYEPLFELGRGGMGTVHLARAVGAGGFERVVVIKRLHAHLLDQPQAVRRFLDEARVAARVHHSNVVSTHQIGNDDEGYFLVLDYVEGGSLEVLLERSLAKKELIPPPIVLRIALDALTGLHAVHIAQDASGRPLNILHRDVSLQNIIVGLDGVARIADFGIAKSALGSVSTDQSYVVGKLLYVPPEHLRREGFGPTLDVYSLGITLWLTLSGQALWGDASEAQLIKHIVDDDVPALSSVMHVAPQIEAIIGRAVKRNPKDRFQSAREMALEIERLSRQTGWVATHDEVAQFVEGLLGAELARRRELLAEHIACADQASRQRRQAIVDDVIEKPIFLPGRQQTDTSAVSADAGFDADAVVPGLQKLSRPLVIGAIVIAVAIAGLFLGLRALRAPETNPELAGSTAKGASTPSVAPKPAASNSAAKSATNVEPLLETAEPRQLPEHSVPIVNTDKPRAKSRGPLAGKPAAGRSRAPGAAPSLENPPLPAPETPSEISKKNPYR